MKQNLTNLAAVRFVLNIVFCCALTTVVFTACTVNDDNPVNPSGDVNKGIVINLGSVVIKPYMQFGASLADVEKYMNDNYAGWTDNNPDALQQYEQQGGTTWKKLYSKDGQTIEFLFLGNSTGGKFALVSYGFDSIALLPNVKSELERNKFTYKGVLKFEDYNADLCQLFLSDDEAIEVQVSSWEKDGGSWTISFQELDKYDLQFLTPAN